MWYNGYTIAGSVLADPTPANNAPVLHTSLTPSGATVFVSLILFGILSIVEHRTGNSGVNLARFAVLALAAGAWIVTTPWLLKAGDWLRGLIVDIVKQFHWGTINPLIVSTVFFTVISAGLLWVSTLRYRRANNDPEKSGVLWLVVMFIAALLFFTTSVAQTGAEWYMNHAGVSVAKGFAVVTDHLGWTSTSGS